jgi:hypothetical protein
MRNEFKKIYPVLFIKKQINQSQIDKTRKIETELIRKKLVN